MAVTEPDVNLKSERLKHEEKRKQSIEWSKKENFPEDWRARKNQDEEWKRNDYILEGRTINNEEPELYIYINRNTILLSW